MYYSTFVLIWIEIFLPARDFICKRFDNSSCYMLTKPVFEIKYTPPEKKPKWRNWQTRYVQGVVRVTS
jgi:hypothetical protein